MARNDYEYRLQATLPAKLSMLPQGMVRLKAGLRRLSPGKFRRFALPFTLLWSEIFPGEG